MTWGYVHTMQYADDVLQNRTPETYILTLTNVTPINSRKKTCYIMKYQNLSIDIRNETRGHTLRISIQYYMEIPNQNNKVRSFQHGIGAILVKQIKALK